MTTATIGTTFDNPVSNSTARMTKTSASTNFMALPSLSPGRDLDAYLNTIGSFPILTPEQEKSLALRFYEENDLDAARELVLSHLRFVVHIARSYSGYGLAQADLIQEGNVGLMKAVKRFDPNVGVRLVSFAVHWIKAEMHEYILRNWRIVKVATTKAQRKLFFNLRSQKKQLAWLNPAETKAIADELGVPEAEVSRMESRLSGGDVAFDGYGADDEEHPVAPVHFLSSAEADPADLVAEQADMADSSERLAASFSQLDERSRDIIQRRWLADEKATLHELAAEYEVSAERIRQLEKNALKKLRVAMEA